MIDEQITRLVEGPPLDVAIIGGGINGCAIALEGARRGLRVALFEADDFGFGTTWRSTKLIHGGLRYLEHGDMRLVFESLRERAWLLKTRPHLVSPQRFLLPLLPWTRRPAWQLRAGLTLYDVLSLYRGVPRHRRLSRNKAMARAPFLPIETTGAFSFFDARIHSPERLALELTLEARSRGATVLNHTAVTRIVANGSRVTAVGFEHRGEPHVVGARTVINAAGPWVDVVNQLTGEPPPPLLGVTRGSHIVLDVGDRLPRDAVFSTAKSDGRVFFAVPQDELLLVGTTDDRFNGDPNLVQPREADVEYLLEEARLLLPGLEPAREEVRYAYAGLRPLPRVRGGPEAAITRRHEIVDHSATGGPEGLYSVIGGKLSTFRPLAREAIDHVGDGVPVPRSKDERREQWRWTLSASGLDLRTRRHLRMYGDAVSQVIAGGRDEICAHTGAIRGEIGYVVKNELVTSLSDVLLRRTGIAWGSCRGLCCHREVAALAGAELGWDHVEQERQVRQYEADVDFHLPAVHCGGGERL
ncbi:MAG: glycerol-3-phosphate dehydrogenase/oxidase [Dehalococcoidia bacterium]|nr:glycerol-3-phosphate dehydrogenase/oxidase [Dehalococcoidia bacterium]